MRFSTLNDWLTWQESLHPSEIDLGLERVSTVLERLGCGRPGRHIITIAGTNGKGSCGAMLEALYQAAGYRVGLYSSPHFIRYNERIRIDGAEVDDDVLCQTFQRIDEARGDISLTYFEFGTLAAIDCFAQAGLDVVILEVGLGGRLDAVNILDPDVALITTIDLDHQAWLGEDRESVGREKAGIMREGRPAVCADPEPPQSVLDNARRLGAELFCLGQDFGAWPQEGQWTWWRRGRQRDALPIPNLRGAFQLNNASAVLMVAELLNDVLPVGQAEIRIGLSSARLPGRFQVIPGDVPMVLDVAHNPQAAKALAATLAAWPMPGETHAVVAMMADKDIEGALEPVEAEVDHWYLAGVDLPRAARPERLAEILAELGVTALSCHDDVATAVAVARAAAQPNDRIVVFGSFYTVADAMQAAYNAD